MQFYINGEKAGSVSSSKNFTRNQNIIWDLWTSNQSWTGGIANKNDLSNNNINTMYVDWVHTYKLVDDGSGGSGGGGGGGTTYQVALINNGSNNYMTASNPMTVSSSLGSSQKFTWIPLADGKIALKGSNGKYVSSENGSKQMTCNRTAIGSWEKFTAVVINESQSIWALKGNNGQYIRNNMWCTSAGAGSWQQ